MYTVDHRTKGSIQMPVALRTERTEARLLPEQKSRIEQAARLTGLSVSDFIVQHADAAAIKTIQLHSCWTLSDRDRDVFLNAILNPPNPNERLKTAAKRYQTRTAR
jgi:uncharacterized protein (DUF1778 family)